MSVYALLLERLDAGPSDAERELANAVLYVAALSGEHLPGGTVASSPELHARERAIERALEAGDEAELRSAVARWRNRALDCLLDAVNDAKRGRG